MIQEKRKREKAKAEKRQEKQERRVFRKALKDQQKEKVHEANQTDHLPLTPESKQNESE